MWTINLLRPVALGAIAAAGCAHLLTDGGRGRFICSRFWLSELFRKQKWRFRRPQKNSRKLPADYQEQVHDMILRGAFVVSTYMIPPELFINADHTGIMQLQVKGSGWFTADDTRERNFEMQGR